ncbi:MAG: GHKL domain-containing protein, partial [Kamptonema sp. SIO4C4]|nr:GHKL domain-containing protein [Kamptonema sp. SIO4C4]
PGQLNQVFMNLLVNAIDALEEHRQSERKIHISTKKVGEEVEIRIRDNAGGIPAEVQEKLFNPFFTTKPVGKGTGLGLAIVHSIIVEKHGGRIHCQSTVNEGTEFILHLPLVPQEVHS